jgi:O-antigen/teichoic acid export membrane protein
MCCSSLKGRKFENKVALWWNRADDVERIAGPQASQRLEWSTLCRRPFVDQAQEARGFEWIYHSFCAGRSLCLESGLGGCAGAPVYAAGFRIARKGYDHHRILGQSHVPLASREGGLALTTPVSKAQTFRNVIYNSLAQGITLTCQLLASMVIARNLSPADMGVVGFAGIIIGFLYQFGDCGVGNAAIRRPHLEQKNLETAYTLKVILGAAAFGAALLVAPFARHFCDHPAVANVTRVLALNFLISTVGFLPRVRLTREMNYRALVVPGIINAVVRCILAISLILCGWRLWAVVMADVGANLAGNLAIQCVKKVPLGFRFNRQDAGEFLRFGLPLLGAGMLTFLIFSMDNFLVSASMGIAQLGYYALAMNWGSFVCGLLGSTVAGVLFPAFAAMQHDTAKMRRWYLKTLDLSAFVAVVANTTLLANTHAFLVIFLGKGTDKWMPAALALQILCFYGIVRAVTEPIANCMMARNQTKPLFHATTLCGLVQIILLVPALYSRKIEWVAVAVLVSYAAQTIVYVPFLRHELTITFTDLIKQLWPVAPAMLAGWWATHMLFPSAGGSLFTLAYRGLFTAAVVAAVHGLLTGFRCFQEARELVLQRFTGGARPANPL